MYRVKPFESAHWPIAKRAVYKIYNKVWRDKKRKLLLDKVANLAPCPPFQEQSPAYTMHTLLDNKNFRMGVVAYKSLVLAAQKPINFVMHDDGSLTQLQLDYLKKHFPGCRIISQTEAREKMFEYLKPYPTCLEIRHKHVLFPKVTDVQAYSTAPRIGFMDSDVLFFKKPDFFLNALETPNSKAYFNKDIKSSYLLPAAQLSKLFHISVAERLNSGLWIMNQQDLNLERLEAYVSQETFYPLTNQYVLDQTLLASLASASSQGVSYLPSDYDVSFEKKVEDSVCKHYVGRIRHGFELEGLSYLINSTHFITRWENFIRNT